MPRRLLRTLVVTACAALGAGVAADAPARAADSVDVARYDVRVVVGAASLSVETTIHATGAAPPRWTLDLVPEMKVASAESGGRAVPFEASGRTLVVDASKLARDADGFTVTVRAEGAPSERFSKERGGFVRTLVSADVVHVRSQVPWYPRAADDPAVHRVVVDAPAAWQVRSAGAFDAPAVSGDRATWTFDTKTPIGVAGLAAGPWVVRTSGAYDALVAPDHEAAADGLLDLARRAVEFHAADLGPLVRPRYALVEMPAAFGAGSGYSECGYILLGPGAFEAGAGASWVGGFLAHETAHQWWGQDALFSDFASEALAEFSMLRCVTGGGGGADAGADAARRVRRDAVERVARAAAAGKTVALGDIRGWGGDLDPETYASHAYARSMMLLSMVADAVGEAAMQKTLRAFLGEARRRRCGWTDLRAALVASGRGAKEIVEQCEAPGLPALRLEQAATKSGAKWKVAGKVVQSGTAKPWRLRVPVVAVAPAKDAGGTERRVESVVEMKAAEAAFAFDVPAEPTAVLLDPDWRVLAAHDVPGADDLKRSFEAAMKVANSSGERDRATLERAVADLRAAIDAKTLSTGEEAAARTGLGRCLFRLDRFDEAEPVLRAALEAGAGGPFHRGWVHLRLGCIADHAGRRDDALAHYRAVVESKGSSSSAVEKAKAFIDRAWRGFDKDG